MDLFDAIYNRVSVRKYTSQIVDKSMLNNLLDAAAQAPSAMNSQPWAFVIIQDTDKLKELSNRSKQYLLNNIDQLPQLEKYQTVLANPEFDIFYDANTLVIVYAKPVSPYPIEDCCLAAQNIMLTAHSLGLGSCWIGFARALLNLPDVKNELNVPQDYCAVAPLIIGYPQARIPKLKKKSPDILAWITHSL